LAKGLDAQQQIFASNPDDRRAFEALEEHFFLEGDWPALARVYRSRIAAPSIGSDAEKKAALLLRLGQILEERILDLDGACEVYWTLARLDPTNRPALRQLRGIHERRGQWDMVLQIAELEGATSMPPFERAQFESDLGRIWARHLGDRGEAERAYHRALALDADFPPALEGLSELCLETGRTEEAARLLERLTTRLRGPERAPFWLSLGRLQAGVLGDRDRARASFAAALEDDPLLTAAVEWSLLLATEVEDWEVVADLLEHRFDLAAGARHRASIAVEASQIHLHQRHSAPSARAWVERASELAEDEGSVLRARADLERAEGNDDALAGVLERLVKKAGARAPRPLFVELAEIHARQGRPAEALATLERSPGRAHGDDQALLELRAHCLRATGRKRELAEVLETLVLLEAGQSPALRASRLRELATLGEEELSDLAGAEAHWQAAFALEPQEPEALAAVVRLQRKREDWPSLRATFEAGLHAAGPRPPGSLCHPLGELLLERFDDPEGARSAFERALASNAGDRLALAGLRRVAERLRDDALLLDVCEREADQCDDGHELAEIARRAIDLLETRGDLPSAHTWAVRATGSGPDSIALLAKRVDLEAQLGLPSEEIQSLARLAPLLSGAERSRRLHRRAELLVEQGNPEAAVESLEAALLGEPDRIETLAALADAHHRLGRPLDQARCLRAWAERLPEDRRAEPLTRLAALLQDPIGDLEAAVAVRWRILDLPSPPSDAVQALESLLELAGRHHELVALLERERRRLGDETPAAQALDLRRGRLLLDALGDCEAAAAIFSKHLERNPGDDEVLTLLERALRAGHDAAGLCDLLARRADWETRPIARAPYDLERAQLLEEVLGQPNEACDVYEQILRTLPDSAASVLARARLEALCEATGQWPRLHRLLLDRLTATPSDQRTPLRERIAEICRDQLHDPAGCATQLEAIAAAHPERVPVWQQLQDLYMRVLERPADWLRVAQAELSSVPAPRRELALRVAIGRLLLDGARRPNGTDAREAIGHYERAFELDPSHAEAVEVLVRHYEQERRPADVARVLDGHLHCLDDVRSADRDELRLRLARVWGRELSDDARAATLLEAVRATRGAVPEVAEPLAEILERRPGPDAERALAVLCRDVLARGGNDREARPWRVRLGRVAARLGELEEAAHSYRAALADTPGDPEIEDALIDLYERLGEREPLIELLERRLAFVPAETELALRLRVARLYAADPAENDHALPHLERILACIPHHQEALDLTVSLATRSEDPIRARELLDRALALPLPTDVRARCLERRGRLAGATPESHEVAIDDLRSALALDPGLPGARSELRRRLVALERWPAALDCLAAEAESATGTARETLLEEGLALAAAKLQPDAALPWLLRLRAERADDPGLWARQAALHRAAGRSEAALRALDEELLLHTDRSERLRVELERATLLERELDAPGRAVLAYQAALALASDRDPILARLDALLEGLGRPLERAVVLEERVVALAGRAGLALRRTLAEIYCVALAKPERALVHLRANVDATADTPHEELHHLGVLAAALRACGREEEWAAVACRELDRIDAHSELRDHTPLDYQRFLREEIARVLDRVLGDPEAALERIRELCDEPRLAEGSLPARLRERLHDLLRRTGRRAELATRLARFLEAGDGGPRDWLELATLLEEDHHDWTGALAAYREAERDAELRLEAIRGRSRCSERLGDEAALVDALRDELAFEAPVPRRERASLARRIGDLAWRRLRSVDAARSAYRTALELDARDRDALASLIEIEESHGERAETIALYRRELELLGDGPTDRARSRAIQLRLAALHGTASEELELAIAAYREAETLGRLSPSEEHDLALLYDRTGDADRFLATLARWCDREDSTAGAADHVGLAMRLSEAGERARAIARAERAVAVGPEHAAGWALLGRLQRANGLIEAAIASLERAAAHALPIEASRHAVEAAAIAAPLDPERAHALLLRAVRADSTSFSAHQALAQIASQLDRPADTIRHAEIALEIATGRGDSLEPRLELALLGGRAARSLGQTGASLRLHQAAIEIAPDLVEALDGLAEAHFASGDLQAAKPHLEHRLARDGGDRERVRPLWMLGCALEAAGDVELAAVHLREALSLDPSFDPAHESLVRLEERAARPDDALAALERWAEASVDPAVRARAALRAAEHLLGLGDGTRARRHLERATLDDPELGEAWVLSCDLAAEQCDEAEVRALCERALGRVEPGAHSARIALRLARLAEVAGDRREAAARYAEAWRWDPRCTEAALCESRLARMAGDWLEADGILARFLAAHPDPTSASLAQVHLERGRLLSGPLEAFEDAIGAYQRALALVPGLAVARSALGGLLLHAPDRWREALALHRDILSAAPTTSASLRAIATLAERQGRPEVATGARQVLAALGLAAPDAPEATGPFGLRLQAGPPLPSSDGERLRRLAHQIRDELGRLLETEGEASAPPALAEILPTAEILAVEDELTAPHLSRQPAPLRRSLFLSLAGLFLDPGGNGGEARFRDPLDRSLGLWTRRKVRRIVEETSLAAIDAFDHEAWGHALRALAAAQIVDRGHGPLRPVLLALIALDGDTREAGDLDRAELGGLVSSCEAARLLLIRITDLLCQKLERGR
jgi:tetratricopeptide (TPR) repeat protein